MDEQVTQLRAILGSLTRESKILLISYLEDLIAMQENHGGMIV